MAFHGGDEVNRLAFAGEMPLLAGMNLNKRKAISREIARDIEANVRLWWSDKITWTVFGDRQKQLWDRATICGVSSLVVKHLPVGRMGAT